MIRTGKITFEDSQKHQFTLVIRNCNDLNSVKTIAEKIQAYSTAALYAYSLTEEVPVIGNTSSGNYDRVEQQLKLVFRSDAEIIYVYIPAPTNDAVDAHQEAPANIAGEIKTLIEETTSFRNVVYKGGGLTAQYPFDTQSDG